MNKMNRVNPVMRVVYQQGIYLASPLTIVLHTQLDISTEAIVMKVTPRKEMKKVSLQKVQAEGLHFIQPLLHYAPVDDLHHSQSTMQRGLCSSQLDHMNEETWSQAIGTLSKSYPKLDDSLLGRYIHRGRSGPSMDETVSAPEHVCGVFLSAISAKCFLSYCTKLFVGLLPYLRFAL